MSTLGYRLTLGAQWVGGRFVYSPFLPGPVVLGAWKDAR